MRNLILILFFSFLLLFSQEEDSFSFGEDSFNFEEESFEESVSLSFDEKLEPVSIGSFSSNRSKIAQKIKKIKITDALRVNSSHSLSTLIYQLEPSFYAQNPNIASGQDIAKVTSMRGLSSNYYLVLVDGKRLNKSSLVKTNQSLAQGETGFDLDVIPILSVDYVEIFSGSAVPEYGENAVAGVINIVLKKESQNTSATLFYGSSSNKNNFLFAGLSHGIAFSNQNFLNLVAEIQYLDKIDRLENYTGRLFSPISLNDSLAAIFDDSVLQSRGLSRANFSSSFGSPKVESFRLAFNNEFGVNESINFYSHGFLNNDFGRSNGLFIFPNDTVRNVSSLYPNGFSSIVKTTSQNSFLTAGFKRKKEGTSDWGLDFSSSYGVHSLSYSSDNTLNPVLQEQSPRRFYLGGTSLSELTTKLDFSRYYDLFIWSIHLNIGLEHRLHNYKIEAGEERSYQNNTTNSLILTGAEPFAFSPLNKIDEYQFVRSLYGDIEVDILSLLLIHGTLRIDDYNNFQKQVIGKVASRIELSENLSIMSSYSNGFLAPSLPQQFFSVRRSQFFKTGFRAVGFFSNDLLVSQNSLLIPDLAPETSRFYHAGVLWKFYENWKVILDYSNTSIYDRIILSGFANETTNQNIPQIIRRSSVEEVRFFVNGLDTRTQVLDVAFHFDYLLIQKQRIYGSLLLNIHDTKIQRVLEPSSLYSSSSFSNQQINFLEKSLPNINSIFSFFYERPDWLFMVRYRYIGQIDDILENQSESYSDKIISDIAVEHSLKSKCNLQLGIDNVFNVLADRNKNSSNVAEGRFPYSRTTLPVSLLTGSFYYAKLSFSL